MRAAVGVEQQHPRLRPQSVEGVGVVAQRVGAVERGVAGAAGFDERERGRRRAHTANEEPQPQVVFAFGLRITNCAPCRLSL